MSADTNEDGSLDFADSDPFVTLLASKVHLKGPAIDGSGARHSTASPLAWAAGVAGGCGGELSCHPAACTEVGRPCLNIGDSNCDGLVNFGDIVPFTQALTDGTGWCATYPCHLLEANDFDGSGCADFLDIFPFVTLIELSLD